MGEEKTVVAEQKKTTESNSDQDKLAERKARFGITSSEEKMEARKARFNTGNELGISKEKLAARASRFGLPKNADPSKLVTDDLKRKRMERFGIVDQEEQMAKRQKRFGL